MHRTNRTPNFNPSSEPDCPCLSAALSYLSRGWCPVPLCPPTCSGHLSARHKHPTTKSGKVPLVAGWAKWQTLPTADEVREWWAKWPRANVGVVMGAVSGIIGVDADGPEGVEDLLALCGGELPSTPQFTTGGGGVRLLFRLDKGVTPLTKHMGKGKRPLSILGNGSLTVMPPSLHHSGTPYVWTEELSADRGLLPQALPWMLTATRKSKAKQRLTGGGILPISTAPRDTDELTWRARAYLAECEPAVEGEGGDKRTWKVVCKVVGMFSRDSDTALSLLREWNKGNVPPWSEEELTRKVRLAAEQHTEAPVAVKGLVNGRPNGFVALTPPAPPADDVDQPDQVDQLPGRRMSVVPRESVEWLDQPYVARHQVTAIVGKPGVGKSTYLAHLVSLARFTLYFPGEEDLGRVLRPRLEASGVDLDRVQAIDPGDDWALPYARDRLLTTIGQTGADLVVFDPVDDYLAEGLDENSNVAVRRVLQSLRDVAQMSGAAVVLCRHVGKSAGNVMVGSRAWGAHPRAVVELIADQDTPPRRVIRHHKDGLGQDAPARYFELVKGEAGPPTWELGGEVTPEVVELVSGVSDPLERSAVDRACGLILRLLELERMEAKMVFQHAEGERLSVSAMQRAARQVGVQYVREGKGKEHRAYWELPKIIPGIPK